MNTEHPYTLASNKVPKLNCPYCGAKKHWQRYFEPETGEVLPEKYGKCDNDIKCGEWNDPYKDSYKNLDKKSSTSTYYRTKTNKQKPKKEPVFIPISELKKTLQDYDKNIFIQNLLKNVKYPFDVKDVEDVISLYRLGTYAKNGAICFPYIDINQNIRAIQEKIFDTNNHTDKSKKYHTSWCHSRLKYNEYKNKPLPNWLKSYLKNETIVSCLFGEHLLNKYPNNPIALVEAPKTAIYGALYFGLPKYPDDLIWLAVFNLGSLNFKKCKVLKGRNVLLFPDASISGKAFKKWDKQADTMQSKLPNTSFKISNLLELHASEQDKINGKDLADYLINHNWREYRPKALKPIKLTPIHKKNQNQINDDDFFKKLQVEKNSTNKDKANFDLEIEKLEHFFKNVSIPTKPIILNQCSTIINCKFFVDGHIRIIKANSGKATFLPYLNRLKSLKQILTQNQIQ